MPIFAEWRLPADFLGGRSQLLCKVELYLNRTFSCNSKSPTLEPFHVVTVSAPQF